MRDAGPRRLGLGAPNEERFGFVQVVAVPATNGGHAFVSGQVGKDNATGLMRPASTFADHVDNAMENVAEALASAGRSAAWMACTAFVPRLHELGDGALDALRRRVPGGATVTPVGVAELSSPDYRIEVSAVAVGEEDSVDTWTSIPWAGGTPVGAIGGVAGVAIGGVVHLAGHLAWDADGSLLTGTTAEQLAGCYAAIDRTLAHAGLPRAALVAEHVFVVAPHGEPLDFVALCDAHREATAERRPASTLVPVSSLAVPGALACVVAIAVGTPA